MVPNYVNDSFGNSIASSGSAADPYKWNSGGRYYSDAESGLQEVEARYYDPSVGSWISQDTLLVAGSLADSQTVNRYLYCSANPIGRVDPGGHLFGIDDLIVLVAIVVIVAVLSGCSNSNGGKHQDNPAPVPPVIPLPPPLEAPLAPIEINHQHERARKYIKAPAARQPTIAGLQDDDGYKSIHPGLYNGS